MSKETEHQIIQDIHRVRQELGHFPSRAEYLQHGKHQAVAVNFGVWMAFVKKSGLGYIKGKRNEQELKLEAFNHNKKEAEARKKLMSEPPKLIKRLLCISDMHAPYGHPDTAAFLEGLQKKYDFDHVLVGGDELDFHAISFHDSDPDLLSAGHELEAAIKALEPIYKLFPNADVLSSNHGDLVYRKGKHFGLPRHVLKDYRDTLQAPKGWVWRSTVLYQFTSGQKAFATHGIKKDYLAAGRNLGLCFIQFHFHNELGVRYWKINGQLLWAMQCACLVDDHSLALAYNKQILERPVEGCAGVIDGKPTLFPMLLDSHGRWTGLVP